MDNLENFIFYDKIFSESQLLEIINKASSLKTKRKSDLSTFSEKGNRNISFEIDVDASYHDLMMNKYISNIPEKYKKYFLQLIKNNYYQADQKITKYEVSDEYDWHIDFVIEHDGCRCISTITYLNDDYCGGTTEFFGKQIKPKKGYTLMFPSFWIYPHKGSPITFGTKLIYVCHFWISAYKINSPKINSCLSYI